MNFIIFKSDSIKLPSRVIQDSGITIRNLSDFSDPQCGPKGFLFDIKDYKESVKYTASEDGSEKILLYDPDSSSGNKSNHKSNYKKEDIYFKFSSFSGIDTVKQVFDNYRISIIQAENERSHAGSLKRFEYLNRELLEIGIALSAERDNKKLLDLIVLKCRQITCSDAGSLYLIDRNKETEELSMIFKIAHNDSNPTDFTEFRMPVKKESIAGYVALTGEIVKIEDAYCIPEGSEYSFNKVYDKATGYRAKSILTVPMKNHKGRIIGVIQLINKKTDWKISLKDHAVVEESVLSFDREDEDVVLSLASLAAVSLDNNQLYHEIEELFECLVKASAKAIEQRDPATSGHSLRVAKYTVAMARAYDSGGRFSSEHLQGLRYACLLHDFGKVGVREHVLVKAKKLYPGMLEQILLRLDNMKKDILIRSLEEKLKLSADRDTYKNKINEIEKQEKEELERIETCKAVIQNANETTILDSPPQSSLEGMKGELLTEDEYTYLSVKRGSLTGDERAEIMSHASHTYDFLKNIPWPESMEWIPDIAKWHHEALDGSGYPDMIKDEKIPLESRMMAVADIFDALTAGDRPYKKALPVEKALSILKEEGTRGKLDKEIVDLFIDNKIYDTPGQT